MGFYLRKGFNLGPLRFNLSRSGLGTSIGIKGFRVGVGPRGAYLHAGRGGFYYRQSLGSLGSSPAPQQHYDHAPVDEPLYAVDSADVGQLTSASSAELLRELNRVQERWDLAPLAGLVVLIALGLEMLQQAPLWIDLLTLLTGLAMVLYARNYDVVRGTAALHYDLDGEAEARFNSLKNSFAQVATCKAVWHVQARGQTSDWKRNAGANELVDRSVIHPSLGVPRRVQTNVEVPTLQAGRQRLYFFPDQLLVYDASRVGAVSYARLHPNVDVVNFREDAEVPTDASVIGTTWRYVNRSGGPDGRFSNNRELPIVLYGLLQLESESGLREHFQCSRADAVREFASALGVMASGGGSGVAGVTGSNEPKPSPESAPDSLEEHISSTKAVLGMVAFSVVIGVFVAWWVSSGVGWRFGAKPPDYLLMDRQGNDLFAFVNPRWRHDTVQIGKFGVTLCGQQRPCTVRFWSDPNVNGFGLPLSQSLAMNQVAEYDQDASDVVGLVTLGAAQNNDLAPGAWVVEHDSSGLILLLKATPDSALQRRRLPILGVRCQRGRLKAYIDARIPLAIGRDGASPVILRWNGYPGVRSRWRLSRDATVAFPRDVTSFVNDGLLITRGLRVELHPKGSPPRTLYFDVHGYREQARELRTACPKAGVATVGRAAH